MSKKRKRSSSALQNLSQIRAMKKWSPLFLFPTFIAFCIGFVWPFIWGIYLSFFRFKTLRNTTFVGIDNYVKAFTDNNFGHAFWFTVLFTVVSVVVIKV